VVAVNGGSQLANLTDSSPIVDLKQKPTQITQQLLRLPDHIEQQRLQQLGHTLQRLPTDTKWKQLPEENITQRIGVKVQMLGDDRLMPVQIKREHLDDNDQHLMFPSVEPQLFHERLSHVLTGDTTVYQQLVQRKQEWLVNETWQPHTDDQKQQFLVQNLWEQFRGTEKQEHLLTRDVMAYKLIQRTQEQLLQKQLFLQKLREQPCPADVQLVNTKQEQHGNKSLQQLASSNNLGWFDRNLHEEQLLHNSYRYTLFFQSNAHLSHR
jgi:hypothetical protein